MEHCVTHSRTSPSISVHNLRKTYVVPEREGGMKAAFTSQSCYRGPEREAYTAMTMEEASLAVLHPPSSPVAETIPAEFLALLRAHGVTRAYLFGSVVTGRAGPNSDLDLLVSFDRPVPLFDQLRLAERLGKICGRPVDLVTDIHPAFLDSIVPTLVPLRL